MKGPSGRGRSLVYYPHCHLSVSRKCNLANGLLRYCLYRAEINAFNEWTHCCVKCSHTVARKRFFLRVLSGEWLHCFLMEKQHFGFFHFPDVKTFSLYKKRTSPLAIGVFTISANICGENATRPFFWI